MVESTRPNDATTSELTSAITSTGFIVRLTHQNLINALNEEYQIHDTQQNCDETAHQANQQGEAGTTTSSTNNNNNQALDNDKEDHALICLRIIFDLHKDFRPLPQHLIEPLLDFMVEVYSHFDDTVRINFTASHIHPAAMTEVKT